MFKSHKVRVENCLITYHAALDECIWNFHLQKARVHGDEYRYEHALEKMVEMHPLDTIAQIVRDPPGPNRKSNENEI